MAYPETMSEIANYPKALSHAGTGGGVALKSILFSNTTGSEVRLFKCISAEGKYIDPVGESDEGVKVSAGETATVYYPELSADSEWRVNVGSLNAIVLQTSADGIEIDATAAAITAEAPDGATVVIALGDDGGES